MDRPSARLTRLLRLARTLRRLRRRPRRTATEIALIEAHLWARRLGTRPYVRGFKGVSLLPPTRAADDLVVDDPPNWRPARKGLDVVDILLSAKAAPHLSESPAALADLLARWNEMPAAFWPQRG